MEMIERLKKEQGKMVSPTEDNGESLGKEGSEPEVK
jgi:hypothetical protein